MYSKCYLFLKVSPSSRCPLQLQKSVHLGQDIVPNFFFATSSWVCYQFIPADRFAYSLAMIAHFTKSFKSAIERITPSQIPAIAVGQPLIPLAEQTQWTLGEMYNEDQCVIMFGGLYVEMTAFSMLGLVYYICNYVVFSLWELSEKPTFPSISRSVKVDFTNTTVLCTGSYQLRQMALCTSSRHVWTAMQASRCVHIQNSAVARL